MLVLFSFAITSCDNDEASPCKKAGEHYWELYQDSLTRDAEGPTSVDEVIDACKNGVDDMGMLPWFKYIIGLNVLPFFENREHIIRKKLKKLKFFSGRSGHLRYLLLVQ